MPDNVKFETARIFKIFEEICAIPHGSGNMSQIAQYCVDFAEKNSLKYVRDAADNVVIYKPATKGYEAAEPIILQGHTDMVCQKEDGIAFDFLKDALQLYTDGDFIKAKGTTLGADNGIAVAIIMSILESNDIKHPPIEAVFTTDEEIGMIGAKALDMNLLSAKRMINLDAEEDDTLTVSCAGGSDFLLNLPLLRKTVSGKGVTVAIKGLSGGHSGVEIGKGRVNAVILTARILKYLNDSCEVEIISIDGGEKANAIPNGCTIRLCTNDTEGLIKKADERFAEIKAEIYAREPAFELEVTVDKEAEYNVFESDLKAKIINYLICVPNGVMEMSAEIAGLVETSLNLGILKTEAEKMIIHHSLRSNKLSAMSFLEERLKVFASSLTANIECFGHYPPWEYKRDSALRELYKECFTEQFGCSPKVEAIHAGLECAIFASRLPELDCIAMGPALYDVHTVNEKLKISSAEQIYKLLLRMLEKCQ